MDPAVERDNLASEPQRIDGVARDQDTLGDSHGQLVAPGSQGLFAGRLIDEERANHEVRAG